MPRHQKKGNRDDEYKPAKNEDLADVDIDDEIAPKATEKLAKQAKPVKVTQKGPSKGASKQQAPKGTPKGTPKNTPKGTPKVTPRSTPKPPAEGAYNKPSPPPNTSTAAPSSTTIKTPSPSDPYFCCHDPLPLPSSFPPALQPFYTFLISSKFHPPPIGSLPPSKTYYRFSHLSLTTCTEVHRYFLGLDPTDEAGLFFVEGSEEEVLGKAGALDDDGTEGRRQDVMILSRNARCKDHMKEGFWYVLMRVEQVLERPKEALVEHPSTEDMEHEIDLDLYS
ncbi:hypothetical protein EYC84_008261 [Monilinia fructicola]|uniref:Uncharacterized protein n=1 Tax=Monilinia fructicola TaxID=38448 RepID=A0A5M9JEK8_MONFR|nr:hypothetical protein EYC84_008261 [Monilinia fructicola]